MGTKTKCMFLFITPKAGWNQGTSGEGIAELQGEEAGPGRWLGGGLFCSGPCVFFFQKNTPHTLLEVLSVLFL